MSETPSEKRANHLRAVPGVEDGEHKTALALAAVVELASRLNLDTTVYTALYESVRSLDDEHAELVWHTIGDVNELLIMFGIDPQD